MSGSPVVAAHRLVSEAVEALAVAAGPTATPDEALSVLTVCEGVARRLDRLVVGVVADLVRRGVFAERGYRDTVTALADLLGWDRAEARRRVSAAEQVCPRVGLDGSLLPARLPATAEKFTGGSASLRHVDVVSRVLGSPAARLSRRRCGRERKPRWPRTPISTTRPSCWSGAPDWSTPWTRTAPSPTTGRPSR